MKKFKSKNTRRWFAGAILGLVLIIAAYFILKPIDSYSYSISGCVGLGTSTHKTKRYSLLSGEKQKFYQDKDSVSSSRFKFIKALCDSDTETHTLYLFQIHNKSGDNPKIITKFRSFASFTLLTASET